MTVLARVLVNTGAARMGTDAVPLPDGPISAEQAVDEALTEAIKARPAASQPAH